MVERKLDAQDVEHLLRTGMITQPAEEKDGLWRYRVRRDGMGVAVAFCSGEVICVTA